MVNLGSAVRESGRRSPWIIAPLVLHFIYRPFVAEQLWNWFAAPAVNGPQIGYIHSCGLFLLIGIFKEGYSNLFEADKDPKMGNKDAILHLGLAEIASATIGLAFGWILHTFLQ